MKGFIPKRVKSVFGEPEKTAVPRSKFCVRTSGTISLSQEYFVICIQAVTTLTLKYCVPKSVESRGMRQATKNVKSDQNYVLSASEKLILFLAFEKCE